MSKVLTSRLLFVIPIAVAIGQMALSHFSSLNRWKGGGFGMYATPHPRDQTIWLEYDSASSRTQILVSPLSPSAKGREMFKILEPCIPQLLVFPSTIGWNSRLKQRLDQWKTVGYQAESYTLVTAERNWNLKERMYFNKPIYRFDF
jgi:hypothetical protein